MLNSLDTLQHIKKGGLRASFVFNHCLKITPEASDSLLIFDNIIILDLDLK